MERDGIFHRLAARAIGPSQADLADNLELAVSAQRFSRRTTAVVDDKLSFSAALMRAGEVDAAQRLLAEVEEEVLIEEAALIERVNEVKVSRSMSHEHMTRGRLARTLAVAMLGSSLLAFSAAGMAVVGLFRENDRAIHDSNARSDGGGGATLASHDGAGDRGARRQNIAGISVRMTPAQKKRYKELQKNGFADEDELERFLLELLPTPLADKIHLVLVTGMQHLPKPVRDELKVAASTVIEKHREVSSQGGPSDKRDGSSSSKDAGQKDSKGSNNEPSGGGSRDEPSPSPTPGDETPPVPVLGDEEEGG